MARTVPVEVMDRALELYLEGYSPRRIPHMLSGRVSESSIRRMLKQCGVPMRPGRVRARRLRHMV